MLDQQNKIGILALQGAYREHAEVLDRLEIKWKYVKQAYDLKEVDALIIPGGESTSMLKLIDLSNLKEPLDQFIKSHPVMGTCAGLILLAKKVIPEQFSFPVLDIEVERNAYGAQLDSFSEEILLENGEKIPGVFIRAPRISKIISEDVEIIGTYENTPVFVRQNNIFGLSFHPELTHSTIIHSMFVENIQKYVARHS